MTRLCLLVALAFLLTILHAQHSLALASDTEDNKNQVESSVKINDDVEQHGNSSQQQSSAQSSKNPKVTAAWKRQYQAANRFLTSLFMSKSLVEKQAILNRKIEDASAEEKARFKEYQNALEKAIEVENNLKQAKEKGKTAEVTKLKALLDTSKKNVAKKEYALKKWYQKVLSNAGPIAFIGTLGGLIGLASYQRLQKYRTNRSKASSSGNHGEPDWVDPRSSVHGFAFEQVRRSDGSFDDYPEQVGQSSGNGWWIAGFVFLGLILVGSLAYACMVGPDDGDTDGDKQTGQKTSKKKKPKSTSNSVNDSSTKRTSSPTGSSNSKKDCSSTAASSATSHSDK